MQRIALMSGSDWYDSKCDLINLPDGVDIDECEAEYKQWKKDNWSSGNYIGHNGKYIGFGEWLSVFKGATESDVIEHWEGMH